MKNISVAETETILTSYKNTEVGLIPQDWKVISIVECIIPNGLIRGPFGGALKKNIFVKSGFKVYEQKNAIYKNVTDGNYYIDYLKFSELKRFQVDAGDFIVSCSGTIGRIYQIPSEYEKGVINQALLIIRIDEDVCVKSYFQHVFSSNKFQDKIIDSTQGGAMKNLVGMKEFKNTTILIPPLHEQTAIARALTDADVLIANLQKLIEKKKRIKQGAMQELLRPKEGWVKRNIGRDAILKARIGWQGLTVLEYKSSGNYRLVTGVDFHKGSIDWSNCVFVDEIRYVQDKNIQLKNGDILVTKDGTIGKVAFVDDLTIPSTLNSGVFVIRPTSNSWHPQFLYYILTSEHFVKFLSQLSAGSTISHLYQKDFVSFDFWTPQSSTVQMEIATVLMKLDSQIQSLEIKLEKLQLIKQGMMQNLLTGKIRLV
jgi:type I restriction enzyme S subunit